MGTNLFQRRSCWSGILLGAFGATPVLRACPIHESALQSAVPQDVVQLPVAGAAESAVSSTAAITAWKQNLTGATGHSSDPTINSFVSTVPSDVQQVWYDANYAYIKYTDVPSHNVGPFPGNPAYPANQNRTSRISRTPTEAANKVATGLGPIGVMVNGGLFFNAADAFSYNNLNIWHRNANIAEATSFDSGRGHPAPVMGTANPRPGTYHYHQSPAALIAQLDAGNTGQRHSPLLGFAWDSFPVYGPYGYSDPSDPASAIKRITTGYKIRDDIAATGLRRSLTDGGATLPQNQWGPDVSATNPAGLYLEDFEWEPNVGDLNQYNMRFTVTPEYPQGTWAYFVTTDAAGNATYPYIVGPQYFGVVDTAQANVTIPAAAVRLLVGDANVDQSVNIGDFALLASHFNSSGQNWETGDFNRDGVVSIGDFSLLAANFNTSGLARGATAAAVPEPGFAVVLAGLVARRRRRDSR